MRQTLELQPRCRLTETECIRAWWGAIRELVASTVREDSPETVAETLARRLARAYEPPVRRADPRFDTDEIASDNTVCTMVNPPHLGN